MAKMEWQIYLIINMRSHDKLYIMMISNTVNPKGKSPSRMRHVMVLLVFSLKFTNVKMQDPVNRFNPKKVVVIELKYRSWS